MAPTALDSRIIQNEPCGDSIPIIDYSKLTSSDPKQRTLALTHLHEALSDWGNFLLINHGVPESLMKGLFEGSSGFFNLPAEEKQQYVEKKDMWQPYLFDATTMDIDHSRSFLTTCVHPQFHFPAKPDGFSDMAREHHSRTRVIFNELLKGISEMFGLEPDTMAKAANLDSGYTNLTMNYYPSSSQSKLEVGLVPHTDATLLTMLMQDNVGGLQAKKNNQDWIDVNPIPNSIIVQIGDQLEILTNGKYKSLVHRVNANGKTSRLSIATGYGPPIDQVVRPIKELVERERGADNISSTYEPVTYGQFLEKKYMDPSFTCFELNKETKHH